ncbi:L-myo-inositol-1-phosphate synthase [Acidianus sulfidivorans JP7]|uniref:L-myo-inositol-1-phosphate synthase n=1 Tax=Acidianus sulfidivorans JP7 TaxID=619593 RepID=A0A2U9INN9_9CREN|nr:L-myo-inositol-1-phosphate synthase [Acidianus sulfidivorans]AWR97621.1 L-myo-inositol-1-phosphate synthase [Acidianus sulfidivorans JP7]
MIRVGLIGVGNSASALVQALEKIKNDGLDIPGILDLPLKPQEIEIVAAFDIDKRKVGKKISEAIFSKPNVVEKYVDVHNDVIVQRGPTLDGIDEYLSKIVEESDEKPVDVYSVLKENKVDVVLNLLPVGAEKASNFYASEALKANASFINATPANVTENFGSKFEEMNIPLFGDDLISQIGGTILHSGIIEFLQKRGVRVIRSYQIDIAGNTETFATLEDSRKDLKKRIKSSYISQRSNNAEIVAGTSDYVEFLGDRRVSYMVIEGEYALGSKVRIDISMKTLDSTNAVQPLLDLIRIAKIAKDKGIGGPIPQVCGYYFKNSIKRYNNLDEARQELIKFLQMMK